MMSLFGSAQPEEPPPPRADDGGLREKAPAAARYEAARKPRWRRLRLLFNGRRPEPLPSFHGTVEAPRKGKLGVCCSGGGIRSAAFSLGALQALQERRELGKASYLAAVSGGSYLAAAISMVAKTGKGNSDPGLIDSMPAFAQGSPEEQYLRNRCSYLAPTLTDKVYLGMRILLGLLLNLIFVSLPLIGLALILSGLLYGPLLPGLTGSVSGVVEYQANLPAWFWQAPLAVFALSLLFGLGTLLFRWRAEEWERFFATWAVRFLFLAALLALLLVGIPYIVEWFRNFGSAGRSAHSVAKANAPKFGAGTIVLLAGVAAQLGQFIRSKPAKEDLKWAKKTFNKVGAATRLALAYAAGALIGPLLLLGVFAMTVAIGVIETPRNGSHGVEWWIAGIGVAVLALFTLLYSVADLTTWSLHPYYKRRLSSAFALKRVKLDDLDADERGRVEALEPSTHGVAVERNFDDLVPISRTAVDETNETWPTLVVCAAANISDTAATPPGRAVTSFTFSANTVGGPLVGAVGTARLEQAFGDGGATEATASENFKERCVDLVTARKHRRNDLSLLSAVAMSGAAISPSMGKMTAKPLRFLMALANVRLGVWVPNPRWVAADGENPVPSRPRPSYLVRELLGLNNVDAKYLYVTDGGHYENLGLVELLRRGCTDVYCLDASGVGGDGAEFKTLGDAIALARSELNVEIAFSGGEGENPEELAPAEKEPLAKRDVVTATIQYPPGADGEAGPKGTLVYVRNTLTAKAPWDVRAHHESDPRFPNNPTVDQLYTDQKFEAYRALGAEAGSNAYGALRGS